MTQTNLFVHGLPEGLDDNLFRQLFQAYGKVVSTRYFADLRYGFVTYASAQEAEIVIRQANGFEYRGCIISVRLADYDQNQALVALGLSNEGCAAGQAPGLAVGSAGALAVAPATTSPSDTLYIRGLPASVTEQSLMEIFSSYGIVTSAHILQSQATLGDPYGETAALVRMATVDQAQWIVDNVSGNIPHGLSRPVQVQFADPPGAGAQMQAGGAAVGPQAVAAPGGADVDNSCLRVWDLPANGSDLYLYKVFSPFGAIDKVQIVLTPQGTCSGVGYVKFSFASEAQLAVSSVNGVTLPDGNTLRMAVKQTRRLQLPSPMTGRTPQLQIADYSLPPAGGQFLTALGDASIVDPGFGYPLGGLPGGLMSSACAGLSMQAAMPVVL